MAANNPKTPVTPTNALANFGTLANAMSGNIAINPQHVVDIKISQYQETLADLRAKLEKEQRRLNKEICDTNNSITAVATKLVKADMVDNNPTITALTKYGCKNVAEQLSVNSVNFDKGTIDYQFYITFNNGDRYSNGQLPVQYGNIKITKEIKDLQASKVKLSAQLDDVSVKMQTVFDNLSKLPNLERKIRAQMAKFFLEKTEGGDELVKSIEDNISIPGLDTLTAEINKL